MVDKCLLNVWAENIWKNIGNIKKMKNRTEEMVMFNKGKAKRKIRFGSFLILVITLIFCMSFGVTAFGDTESRAEASQCVSVTVQSGDTLWNLIQEYNPDYSGNMNEAVYLVKIINDLGSSCLQSGQIIKIPVNL